jgi:hypothetical protein
VGTASSLVCSSDKILQCWSEIGYVYKILPYPVNLKQGGKKSRSVQKARDMKSDVLSSKLYTLQPPACLTSLASIRFRQPKQLHRLLRSGTSFGRGVEKLSWVGMDTDSGHTVTVPDHFFEGCRRIGLMRI